MLFSRQHRIVIRRPPLEQFSMTRSGILFVDAIQPCQIRSLMLQRPSPKLSASTSRTNTRLNIVVLIDMTNTVVPYHTVDDFGHMLNHKRMTEIQLITASVITTLAVAQGKKHSSGRMEAFLQLIPITSSSSQTPGIMPFERI